MTTLRDALGAPFVFRGQTVVSDDGAQRVVAYPEIGCEVAGQNMIEMMDELELARVRAIVSAVAEQRAIVPLRAPVAPSDVEGLLRRAGLADWIPRLDEDLPTAGMPTAGAVRPGNGNGNGNHPAGAHL